MANQALIDSHSMVLDPFCGTGSLLISAAAFGGMAYGSDIDMRVLRGNKCFQHGVKKSNPNYVHKQVLTEEADILENTKDHSIYANFRQYGLPRPELVRCDLNSLSWKPYDKLGYKFDAILCDPPYGIRAGARKTGTENPVAIPEQYQDCHHPRTQLYDQKDIMYDLLQFVAKYLRVKGRFVYLLPATIDFDDTKDLPTHPCLRMIGNSEQKCQGIFRRRLITMEKDKEFEEGMVPHIPPKPDFADMKNKIFYKQHSHFQNGNGSGKEKDKGNKRWRKKKEKREKREKNKEKGDLQGKRKDSPILKEVVNPKDVKRPKLILNESDNDLDDKGMMNENANSTGNETITDH